MGKLGSPAPKHGTTSRYRYGCRCPECRDAHAAYNQRYCTQGPVNEVSRPVKPVVKPEVPGEPGPVELATRAQLAGLSRAVVEPALAAGAVRLAQLLDSDRSPSAYPQAMKQLSAVLGELKKGSDLRKSGLASVRAMSVPDKAAG